MPRQNLPGPLYCPFCAGLMERVALLSIPWEQPDGRGNVSRFTLSVPACVGCRDGEDAAALARRFEVSVHLGRRRD